MKKIIFALILILSISCFAANEIHYFDTSGQSNLYCRVIKASNLYVWDTDGSAYAASPTWANTDIALTEEDTDYRPGVYVASMPTSAIGKYYIEVYSGSSPAKTDTRLQVWEMPWSGTAEIVEGDNTLWLGLTIQATGVAGVPVVDVILVEAVDATDYVKTRTIPAADYFDPDNDAVASVVEVTNLGSNAVSTIWNKDISGYSGAGYAGTYMKNVYDWWLDGGRLDLILDTAAAGSGDSAAVTAIKAKTDLLPSVQAGKAGGVMVQGRFNVRTKRWE